MGINNRNNMFQTRSHSKTLSIKDGSEKTVQCRSIHLLTACRGGVVLPVVARSSWVVKKPWNIIVDYGHYYRQEEGLSRVRSVFSSTVRSRCTVSKHSDGDPKRSQIDNLLINVYGHLYILSVVERVGKWHVGNVLYLGAELDLPYKDFLPSEWTAFSGEIESRSCICAPKLISFFPCPVFSELCEGNVIMQYNIGTARPGLYIHFI